MLKVRFRGEAAMIWQAIPARSVENDPKRTLRVRKRLPQPAFLAGGGDHVPSRIEGGVSLGQYIRINRMNWSLGAGSQLA